MSGPGRELKYCLDMRDGDTVFWVTDFGWVMAPYELVGSHFSGHSCLLYESVPNHPTPDRLWQIIARTRRHTPGSFAHGGARVDKRGR